MHISLYTISSNTYNLMEAPGELNVDNLITRLLEVRGYISL